MITTSPNAVPAVAILLQDRQLLDINAARAELASIGLSVSRSQMARWASERALPFFIVGRRLFIQRSELHFAIQKKQAAAVRGEGGRRSRRRQRGH